jgi:hypothetical protein
MADGFDADLAPLTELTDEFNDAHSLRDWRRIRDDEHWPVDRLAVYDVDTSRAGWLRMVPDTGTWYQDYVSEMTYRPVVGDFVVTTFIQAHQRVGDGPPGATHGGAPNSEFSLIGLMVRVPRVVAGADTAWWQPGHENYLFLSFGAGNQPGVYQFEAKTTLDSQSTLSVSAGIVGVSQVELRVARIGAHVIQLLRQPGEAWRVHARFRRDDLPALLQVGLTCYTDWAIASTYDPYEHNRSVITHAAQDANQLADPDLRADIDYVRYARPQVPGPLIGADLSNPQAVSDAQLLSFLGQD